MEVQVNGKTLRSGILFAKKITAGVNDFMHGGNNMVAYGYMNTDQNHQPPNKDFWEQVYSVEFSIRNVKFLYQFKIWKIPENPAFVLVKDNSDILNWIKTGDTLDMKYYSSNPQGSTQEMPTKIIDIKRHYDGRFKGHYVVSLGALDN